MNLGKTALQVLKAVAPTLALAVGGPFGPLAAAAIHAALGSTDQASAEATLTTATPEQLLALKNAETAFLLQMKTLGVQEEQLQFADIANARSLEVQTRSSTPTVLSYCVLGASMAAFLGVVAGFVKIPTDPQTALIYGSVLTYLVTESKAVLGYWFGTSIGSQSKDETIAGIAKQS